MTNDWKVPYGGRRPRVPHRIRGWGFEWGRKAGPHPFCFGPIHTPYSHLLFLLLPSGISVRRGFVLTSLSVSRNSRNPQTGAARWRQTGSGNVRRGAVCTQKARNRQTQRPRRSSIQNLSFISSGRKSRSARVGAVASETKKTRE